MALSIPLPHVESTERVRFVSAFVGAMCVTSASLIARTAGDTLFLSSYGRDFLPYMFIGTPLVVSVLSYAFGTYLRKFALSQVIMVACVFLASCCMGLWVALAHPWGGFRIAAYFLGDLIVCGSMLLFWSFFGQIFNSRHAKRLLGPVGAGGTFACILAGLLVGPYTQRLGTANLLLLVALLLLIFGGAVFYLYRHEPSYLQTPPQDRQETKVSNLGYYTHLVKMVQVRNLALLVLVATVAVTLVDYQFKASVQSAYQGQTLAAFFGNFYFATNVLTLLIQVFLVSRLLQGSLLVTLYILPVALLVGSLGTSLTASFGWIVATKFIVQTATFTIDNAALQILYLGIRKQSYSQARAFIDGICKPLAMGVTGVVLVAVSDILPIYSLALGVSALAIIWLALVRKTYRVYVKGLIEGLGTRLFDLPQENTALHHQSIEPHIKQALRSAPSDDLPYLLSIMGELEEVDWAPEMRLLLRRKQPEVKVAALNYLKQSGNKLDFPAILENTKHPLPEVRQAAVSTAVALCGETAMDVVEASLRDPHPEVQAEAAIGLIKIGNLNGLLTGFAALKTMIESDNTATRSAAVLPLSRMQIAGKTTLFLELLNDTDKEVRSAALQSCINCPDPQLVPVLLSKLRDPASSEQVVDALFAFGSLTLDYLDAHTESVEVREMFYESNCLPNVLVRIGGVSALNILRKVLDKPTAQEPIDLIDAYCRLLKERTSINPYLDQLDRITNHELDSARKRLRNLHHISSLPGNTILCEALQEEYQRHLQNLLLLLGVRVPGVDMHMLYPALRREENGSRIQALEVLDNVLRVDLREKVLSVVDPSQSRLGNQDGWGQLLNLLQSETSKWVLVGALYAAGESRQQDWAHLTRKFLRYENAIIRETALHALIQIKKLKKLPEECSFLLEDPDFRVCKLARSLAQHSKTGVDSMIVVEKMLFLRHVPLFSKMVSSELGRIAHITQETVYPAGTKIIQEGEQGDCLYLIVDGEVLIHKGETRLNILKSKSHFGEMSIIDGEPRSASATALVDCLTLRIDRRDFNELLSTRSQVAVEVIRVLNRRLRETSSAASSS